MANGTLNTGRIRLYLSLGILIPPAAWFILNYLNGLFTDLDEALAIIASPWIWLYVIVYSAFIHYRFHIELGRITGFTLTQAHLAQTALRRLPRLYMFTMPVYALVGSLVALLGHDFIDEREFVLGSAVGLPTIFLFSIPFLLLISRELENGSYSVPLPRDKKLHYIKLSTKLVAAFLMTIIGGSVFLLASVMMLLKDEDIYYDVAGEGLIIIGVFVFIAVVNIILFNKQLQSPLDKMLRIADKIRNNDFRIEGKTTSRDETGYVLAAFGNMATMLANSLGSVSDSALGLHTTKADVESIADTLYGDAQKQAASLQQTSASMEELSATVQEIHNQSGDQLKAVESVMADAVTVEQAMSNFVDQANAVSGKSQAVIQGADKAVMHSKDTVSGIENIQKSVSEIVSFINVISSIAEQTNLLALNASIEAARAGDEGRGFAVVAEEVSKLADNATQATQEIQKLIATAEDDVKKGAELVVGLNEDIVKMKLLATQTADIGLRISDSAKEQLTKTGSMAENTRKLKSIADGVVNATLEHRNTTGEITTTIDNLNNLSLENVTLSESIKASSGQLGGQIESLLGVVQKFKLKGGQKKE